MTNQALTIIIMLYTSYLHCLREFISLSKNLMILYSNIFRSDLTDFAYIKIFNIKYYI